jgi:hypothetical protein
LGVVAGCGQDGGGDLGADAVGRPQRRRDLRGEVIELGVELVELFVRSVSAAWVAAVNRRDTADFDVA